MSRLKLKQIFSNLHYNESTNQLIISSSLGAVTGSDIVLSGSLTVTQSIYNTGSITISGVDTFGDSGSFYTVDLGNYWYLLSVYYISIY